MIDPDSGTSTFISAIFDWKRAVLAPRMLGCAPPMWLWAWPFNENEDKRLANHNPSDPEQQEIKELFEATVRSGFLEQSYRAKCWIVRRLFNCAVVRISFSSAANEADTLIDEWTIMRDPRNASDQESQRTCLRAMRGFR